MTSDDAFGFGSAAKPKAAASLADKLTAVKPAPPTPAPASDELDKVDKAAEKRGFVSRESKASIEVPRRRKGEAGPFVAINTRAPIRVADPFIAWCERERYSYWQGIEELMRRAALLK